VAALSASLAHEIRNPLASIRSSVEQLARTAQADEDDRYLAQLIIRESDRLSRLLNEFLDFSRVRATKFAPVDLQAVVTAANVRHPDCKADTEIRVQGQRTVLEGDEDLLYRVVVNLVLNAAQAAKGPVVITVTTGPAKVEIFRSATTSSARCGSKCETPAPAFPKSCEIVSSSRSSRDVQAAPALASRCAACR
jgi:two-component system sensor histidine kinase PilS (NtrC family)